MNLRSVLLSVLLLSATVFCNCQDISSKILMTVDNKKVEAGEFIRMYEKSTINDKSLSVDNYLQQYILFKLKVADAVRQGLNSGKSFNEELAGYRIQLSQNYLIDKTVKDNLLKQAYERSLVEINAWHILISFPQDPSPEDTLLSWKKANEIRVRIVNGESFEQVARGASDDVSVQFNGGDLGYFTVFQMISPFEDAVYTMKPGELSQPVRTAYGYHIIKVADKRTSRGKVKVAHIMKNAPPGSNEAVVKKAETEINSIYENLINGASFTEFASLFSDHKESAASGGRLDWFGTGEITSEFAEAAFAITDTGKFSKPIRTPHGFHIIKLLERKPHQSFEEMKPTLESKMNQTYLNSVSRRSLVEKLKKEYSFSVNNESLNWFTANTDTLIIQGLRKYDRSGMPKGNIYAFSGGSFTNASFADYVEDRGFRINTTESELFIRQTIDTKSADHILEFENSRLESRYPEFRYLMNEFHDGILMFEISAEKIWNPVSEDTAGLMLYYENHKNEHLTPPALSAKLYTLQTTNNDAEKLSKAFRKYSSKKDPDTLLKKKFNKENDSTLVIAEYKWVKGQNAEIDALDWKEGDQFAILGGYPAVIHVYDIIEPAPLAFENVREEMIEGFQQYLEDDWSQQLKSKYTVVVDNVVLAEIKRNFGQ